MIKKFCRKCWLVLIKIYIPVGLTLSILGVASHSNIKTILFSVLEDGDSSAAVVSQYLSTSIINPAYAVLSLVPPKSRFITIDEELTVVVSINTGVTINAVEATISFPHNDLELVSVSKRNSVITEWIQGPTFSNEVGIIKFVGIINDGGFNGKDKVLTLVFKPKKLGESRILFTEGSVLSHGASGVDVLKKKTDMTYFVRRTHLPSPDLNLDNIINSLDIKMLNSHWGELNSVRYDLNQDGEVSLPDFNILSSLFKE